VRSATNDYLARLTDDELERQVSFFGRESSVADVVARFVAHTACHAGEIAAVKGMQGLQGQPFLDRTQGAMLTIGCGLRSVQVSRRQVGAQ
jgi:hypothetical protein